MLKLRKNIFSVIIASPAMLHCLASSLICRVDFFFELTYGLLENDARDKHGNAGEPQESDESQMLNYVEVIENVPASRLEMVWNLSENVDTLKSLKNDGTLGLKIKLFCPFSRWLDLRAEHIEM